eukprot:360102-Chlamydomonas_euryale.AAC.12
MATDAIPAKTSFPGSWCLECPQRPDLAHQPCTSRAPAVHQPGTSRAPAVHQPRTSRAPAAHQPCTSRAPATWASQDLWVLARTGDGPWAMMSPDGRCGKI